MHESETMATVLKVMKRTALINGQGCTNPCHCALVFTDFPVLKTGGPPPTVRGGLVPTGGKRSQVHGRPIC